MPEQKKYTIKPLKWRKTGPYLEADSLFGTYVTRGRYWYSPNAGDVNEQKTPASAKLAAEAHYRSRLLPALEEVADAH